MTRILAAAACAAALVAGCNDDRAATPAATEAAAPAPVTASWESAEPDLRRGKLLNADLHGTDGVKLGSIDGVITGADGHIVRLLVAVEGSNPPRFVHVPVQDLTVLTRGSDVDLVSPMTVAQVAALPDPPVPLPMPARAPAT